MKKSLLSLLCAVIAFVASAEPSTVYVNPLHNNAGAESLIANRIYKKALLGLTKARTISITSGDRTIHPRSDEAKNYHYIMDINLNTAEVEEAGSLGNLAGSIKELGGVLGIGKTSSTPREPDWDGKIVAEVVITEALSGKEFFRDNVEPLSKITKDKSMALFNATEHFDNAMTDMTDDAFRIHGDVMDATEVVKNTVKKVRASVGSSYGARKGQSFELYKVVGDTYDLIGAAKCEQVLGPEESILSISGKKDADKVVSDLIQNNDGSYVIRAISRAKRGFTHELFPGLVKKFGSEGRLSYLNPYGRTSKPKVGFLGIAINDGQFSGTRESFQNKVLEGMEKVSTIDLVKTIYKNVEAARAADIDGLFEITIDKVINKSERDSQGKMKYSTEIYATVSAYDVVNNRWIEMKSIKDTGYSDENTAKATESAILSFDDKVQFFCEDVFPMAASIINAEEVKKNSVKKVRVNQGTAMGMRKGLAFDIYEQRVEGDEDSLFLLGEGKVEKDGLTASEAVLSVKGKNNGDEKLYELLQNADENTMVVLVSKTSGNIFEKINKIF